MKRLETRMADVTTRRQKLEDHGKLAFYSDDTILIRHVRCSYPHLDKPWTMGEGEPKYQMEGLVPNEPEYQPAIRALQARIEKLAKDNKSPPLPEARTCFKEGASFGKAEKVGYYVVKASEKTAPALRGRRRDPRTGDWEVIPAEDAPKVFYGGCWVNVLIKLWWQDNKHGKRVNANLCAVQFVRDDDAFGRGRISQEDIDDTFDEPDDGDDDDL
jgi:hypothetical protein